MIIDHTSPEYEEKWKGKNHNNGAFFYSVEIVKNIIPRVKTDRNWVTIHCGVCLDHSIVFIHNNLNTERYEFLKNYKDLVLVCFNAPQWEKVKEYGKPIYVPLSVDVKEVLQYKTKDKKLKLQAFAGRLSKAKNVPYGNLLLHGSRPQLLARMNFFKKIYAVGRCAIEAKILGCEVLPYDPRFPDPSIWKILDNKEAAEILQKELDKIDKEEK